MDKKTLPSGENTKISSEKMFDPHKMSSLLLSSMLKKLNTSEREFRALAENTPDYIVRFDTEGRYLYINPPLARLLGKSLSELYGSVALDAYGEIKAAIAQIAESGEKMTVSQIVQTKEGGVEYHEVIMVPERDESGRIISILGIGRDLTERKETEERLHKTKAKLSAIISTIPDLVWVKDESGVYLMCNTAFGNFFGAACGDIVGKTDYDFISREQADFFRQKDAEALASGKICINEEEIQFAWGGQYALLETRKVPVYDGEEFMGVLGIGRDITERKELENRLLMSEDKYRTFFESANDGIFLHRIIEQNGTVEFILEDINQRGCELWDHSKEEILSGDLDLLTIGDYPYTFEEATRRNLLAARGEPQLFDWQIKHKDGSKVWGEVNLRRIQIGNDPFLLSIIRDITERKQSEQRLQQALELNEEIINAIPDILFELDAEGNYLNIWAQDERLLAAQKEILLGKNIHEVLPPYALEVALETMRDVDEAGRASGHCYCLDLPGGKKWFELSASKKKSSGTYIILSRDITEREAL
jgi:PAS domain S-box-containing protein